MGHIVGTLRKKFFCVKRKDLAPFATAGPACIANRDRAHFVFLDSRFYNSIIRSPRIGLASLMGELPHGLHRGSDSRKLYQNSIVFIRNRTCLFYFYFERASHMKFYVPSPGTIKVFFSGMSKQCCYVPGNIRNVIIELMPLAGNLPEFAAGKHCFIKCDVRKGHYFIISTMIKE